MIKNHTTADDPGSRFGNIEAFVIHLRRAKQRLWQVEHIVNVSPVKTQIINAVDGRAMSAEQRENVYTTDKLFEPRYPFIIGAGEIGCFLSHRRAWQIILDKGLDAGLIVEDDLEIEPVAFASALELANAYINEIGYIQFLVRKLRGPYQTIHTGNDCRLVRPDIVPLRTSAQLVGRKAAEQLLALTQTFDRPVDGLLQLTWETGISMACVDPPGVSDRTTETGGSTISVRNRRNVFKRLEKEYLRWRYRRDIAEFSRRQNASPEIRE